MKILIISLPRTGSTSLLYQIAKEKNLRPIFEPFDGTGRSELNLEEDNIVVKTIVCHHPNNLDLIKKFDEVVLLSRKNLQECAESHSYHTYNRKKYNSNKQYVYEEPPLNVYDACYNDIKIWDKELNDISNKIDVPIKYYEDLFNPQSKERLRLNIKRTIL